ncbi:TonB-dependent receptor domain-containing protein [Rufibacter hautae]|uniref:TonB-dependent receptor n=1 Tax=Rufibacter hautae TaxID=2595005 RepID=A0A5B6TBT7_9BACT|nr:outer membrane beta-barrel family protein [Rufibacter hautae]KAA3437616.1 TonB-dependent receptor [Rufibacter hautae]
MKKLSHGSLLVSAMMLCFLSLFAAKAQSQPALPSYPCVIKGTVLDSASKMPLGYVTVLLLRPGLNPSSTTIISNEQGAFEIPATQQVDYQLTLSYLGYKTQHVQVTTAALATLDLDVLTLAREATQLEEVKIIASRPLVETGIDRTTYHVEADPERNSLNSLDMFRKVPHLAVDADDNLLLNGNDNFQILVNGKKSSLLSENYSDVLKGLPASAIQKIEVITSPSARHEAAGTGGIINIITYQKNINGFNGSVNLMASTPKGYSGGAYFSAATGKYSFSSRYSRSTSTRAGNSSKFIRQDWIKQTRLEQTGESNSFNQGENISGEAGYDLTPQDHFTASYNLRRNKGSSGLSQRVTHLNNSGELTNVHQNLNKNQSNSDGMDFGLDYQHRFQRKDQQLLTLALNTLHSDHLSAGDYLVEPLVHSVGRMSTTQNTGHSRGYTLQADYAHPFGNQFLEIGLKTDIEENSSDFQYNSKNSETWLFELDAKQSNSFEYRQFLHAAYVSVDLKKGTWGLRVGARFEATKLEARFKSTQAHADQQYLNFFPTISLLHTTNNNGLLRVTYSQRIERPGLNYLDPTPDVTDPLNISYGNPNLDPATSHNFQLEYNAFFKGISANASAFHHFTHNSIQYFTTLGNDSVSRTTVGNIGRNQNFGLSFNSNTTLFRKLTLNMTSVTRYVKYSRSTGTRFRHTEGITYNLTGSLSWRVGKGWRTNTNLSYNSPNVLLQGKTGGNYWNSLSVNKDFMKGNKASIGLSVRSPFQQKSRSFSQVNDPAFHQVQESYSVIRQFSLAFAYRINKVFSGSSSQK